jgi:hypothetical protein
MLAAVAETAPVAALPVEETNAAPEASVAPTEIARSDASPAPDADLPPQPVDLDALPPPVVADLGPPPNPVVEEMETGFASPAGQVGTAVAATSENPPVADPVTAPASPVAQDTSDLTQLFTEAEAEIRRETSRRASTAGAAGLDGINPELRRTFEAFLRSLEPAAKSSRSDAATRAAFERFLADHAQRDQRSAQRTR